MAPKPLNYTTSIPAKRTATECCDLLAEAGALPGLPSMQACSVSALARSEICCVKEIPMSVRLWPTLPKDNEDNGFAALERPLLEDPAGPYYIVAEVNRRRATIDDDDDATTPTIRVLHGEALLGELSREARDLLKRAQASRLPKPAKTPTLFDGEQLPGEGDQPPLPGDDETPSDLDETENGAPRFLSAVPDTDE